MSTPLYRIVTDKGQIRYAGFLILLGAFYFAQLNNWHASRTYVEFGQTMEAPGEVAQGIEAGSELRRFGVLSIGAFGALTVMRSRQHRLRIRGSMGAAIFIFFAWASASLVWSDDFALALRRVTSFAILWFAAYAVASHYKQREVVFFLFLGGVAFISLGVVAELTLGTFDPTNPAYRFCGTIHPNHQGWNCATLALSGIAMGSADRRRRLLYLGGAMMGIVALALTKSRTSVAAFAIAIVVYGILVSTRRRKGSWVPTALLICTFISLALAALNEAGIAKSAVLLGRVQESDTLSGRIPLWESGVAYIYARPVLGYGFNAFETPEHITELRRALGWPAETFHSEYFDLLLGVGCIGAFIYVFIILSGLKRTFVLFKTYPTYYYALECAVIVFYLSIMLLESPGRDPNIPTFVLFVIMAKRGLLLDSEPHLATAA